jgi:hypothetical protein
MYEYIDNILILLQIFCFMKISKNENKTRSLSVILFNCSTILCQAKMTKYF